MQKALKDWSLDELVHHIAGRQIVAIGEGRFQSEVYQSVLLAFQWSQEQEKKLAEERSKEAAKAKRAKAKRTAIR
jgi:hypothetical protein